MNEYVSKIEAIVRKAAELMLSAEEDKGIESKEGIGNYVTKYDKLVQETLYKELLELIPEATFIGEEEDDHSKVAEGYTFIVDPIDGTTNFARGFNESFISVALLKDGDNFISVCYNPYLDEMFTAEKGKGAYLNGKAIQVSDKSLKEGLVFVGASPYYADLREKTYEMFRTVTQNASDFRRIGSAVLELCYVACGRAEAFIELRLQLWDFSAAKLIVEEAGGVITDAKGNKLSFDGPCSIVATNGIADCVVYTKDIL